MVKKMGGIKGLFKGNFALFTKINCFALSILWFARFLALEKVHFGSFEFRLVPCNISSVLIGARDQKPFYIFFRELTRVHTWGKPKGKQKWLSCNRSGCLLTLFPILFFFFFFRRWHEQKCESFADGQTQSTDGQDDGPQGPPTNGCVFSAINQNFSTNFFVWRHFFCSETLFSSNITVTPTIYAVVALSKIRHKWRWYTQGNEAFYWARRLPNSAFADIYRMIGLRSRYPFY